MRTRCILLAAMLSLGPAMAQTPAKGMLLVAAPEMRDPRFSETVILILHHDSEGAIGVAINRPTWVDPIDVFPEMDFLDSYRGHMYNGGPVARANIVILVRDPEFEIPDTEPVLDNIYVSADPDFLREATLGAQTDQALRLYAGHANWGAGQLDQEIAGGSWRLLPGTTEHVFATEPLKLWGDVLTPGSEMTVALPGVGTAVAARPR